MPLRSVGPMVDEAGVGARIALAAEPISAERARRWLRELLLGSGREDCVDAAELACTELVTNAVLHAHTPVDVSVHVGVDVRVEVRDLSAHLPFVPGAPDVEATTGRGLSLVAAIVDDHGVDVDQVGKTVWFRVGGRTQERSAEEVLAAWDDADWDLGEPDVPPADDVRAVRLLSMPPLLWLTARQHHDTLLRELVLYTATHEVPHADPTTADLARGTISGATLAAIEAAGMDPTIDLGSAEARRWASSVIDVELTVPVLAAGMFAVLQDTLDAAEHLARTGRLLAQSGAPEVIAVRDWVCGQVVAQLAGLAPTRWHDWAGA